MNTTPQQARAELRAQQRKSTRTTINVDVEVDVVEVLEELTDEEIFAEAQRREKDWTPNLLSIYEEFRRRGDAPDCLREYLYERLGRVL